ncbi:hypothetical protein [Ferrimonas gelatinilytica]|uniref:ParE-like toxin domain-containing protein n=1 Tax=Ferrimonas gelatinilytica TaxID=1255257 RepID=A0ABP9S0M4_9GAMM
MTTSKLKSLHQQLPERQQRRVNNITQALIDGQNYHSLGGVRVRCNNNLIRFRLGRNWRLIFRQSPLGYEFLSVVSRQDFETEIKRRR